MKRTINTRFLTVSVLSIFLAGCSAHVDKTAQDGNRSTEESSHALQGQQTGISPGHCRIIGTLVSVDSTLAESGPCSKAPCRATIRVDSVLGYGAAFLRPLAVNSQINVRFVLTVGPTTSELFPNMTDRMPGIQIGGKFQTDVESREEMGQATTGPIYLVYAYKVLN